MSEEQIDEALDRLGYEGARLRAMRMYLREYVRRKSIFTASPVTMDDIATASLIFDGFNRKARG